jgi:hypothetical protein
MPGIGEEMDGAVQQAPQAERHSIGRCYRRLVASDLIEAARSSQRALFSEGAS